MPWDKNTGSTSENNIPEIKGKIRGGETPILEINGKISGTFNIKSHYHTHPGVEALKLGYKSRKNSITPSESDKVLYNSFKGKMNFYILSVHTTGKMIKRGDNTTSISEGSTSAWIKQQNW